ncbi:FMN-binding protein [Alishewanella longhuensis]
MHAFLALETDGNTIIGLNYYEQGETPGLGGNRIHAGEHSLLAVNKRCRRVSSDYFEAR